MKKTIIGAILLILLSLPAAVSAEQFYGGWGLNPVSGEPDFTADNILNFTLAYELDSPWRFSFTNTSFKHKDDSSIKLRSMVIGAEMMTVHKIQQGLTLIGALGPGLFITTSDGGSSASGTSIGLIVTGSMRYALSDTMFISGALHYKNAAVHVNNGSVDGGYTGLFINLGLFF